MLEQVLFQEAARWAVDGQFVTSSGVSAGIDMAVFVIETLWGADVAKRVCTGAEYSPAASDPGRDPFAVPGISMQQAALGTPRNERGATLRLGVLLYDAFELLDAFGPLEIWGMANKELKDAGEPPAFGLTFIAETPVVKSHFGPAFRVDMVYGDEMPSDHDLTFDLLLIPGGVGTLREAVNPRTLALLRRAVPRAEQVMTVCSGSAILASAGLLDGLSATSNKSSLDFLALYGPRVNWVSRARWVKDGKFSTSSGVSAGTDLAVALVGELLGEVLATRAALRAEYVANKGADNDPFACDAHRPSVWRVLALRLQKLCVDVFFAFIFFLGIAMRGITSRVLAIW